LAGPVVGEDWRGSTAFVRGVSLFNAGYYWEAHESWEALWHAHGRRGPTAELLRGLIKMAAAGVKVRERRPAGVRAHARGAAGRFEAARSLGGDRQLGLDLRGLIDWARRIAEHPPDDPAPPGAAVSLVFAERLEPAD
jgi:predicted metal-dependent hydrolase